MQVPYASTGISVVGVCV